MPQFADQRTRSARLDPDGRIDGFVEKPKSDDLLVPLKLEPAWLKSNLPWTCQCFDGMGVLLRRVRACSISEASTDFGRSSRCVKLQRLGVSRADIHELRVRVVPMPSQTAAPPPFFHQVPSHVSAAFFIAAFSNGFDGSPGTV